MPRRYILDDSESSSSEFSETDISLSSPHGRRRVKRQSFSRSRHRVSPDSNAYLNPNLISTVRRSASTGGNRRRRGGDEPMVIIDVNNDVRNRQDSRDRHDRYERTDRHDRHDRHQRIVDFDDDDIEVLRPHRRNRASSNVSATRTPSPRQQQRDWEVLMDQRILARNDIRQDLEITKQQQEIDRLERQLSRHQEKKRSEKSERRESHSRHRFEEIHYEDDLAEKLRKLDRLEKVKRNEEEQRLAEVRAKVKRLEEMERKAEEEEEAKRIAHERHLKEIEERENIKAEKDRLKKELQDEEARKALEESERKKELAILKAQAVDEWKRAEDSKRLKEIKEKEQKDKEFKERLRAEFGYSEEQIEKLLNKEKKDEEKKDKKEKEKEKDKDGKLVILEPEKTTFIKVHRKWLLPQTLDAFRLPWGWDERDPNYIIIKQFITEEFQEELFSHSRRIREGKLVTETSTTLTELKVNDHKKDKMYLVRKKNPSGKAWIFT
ncbi:uncharacterized protein TRUGW13939_02934 [Talaromyces rugulosus]|uniref:Uncharacterized protein n=1 Tax=Talaromyces rugulosus TaxID=121627 RepID=A0A7H8QPQ0_TALRU|nr:uncharacterized protein TRUGW13939_02934 [Talaromyces rugulosus]QKX55836.1 hypothetical protein TRUGW13939_02934 [Talaromyces rugulosus]